MTRTIQKLFPDSRLLSFCLAAVALIVVLMPFHAFFSTWGGTTIGPLLAWKSWKEMLLIVIVLTILIWFVAHKKAVRQLLTDTLVIVVLAYIVLTLIMALFHSRDNGFEATAAGLAANLRFPTILLTTYVIFIFSDSSYTQWRRLAMRYLLGVGIFLAVVGLLQVSVLPKDFLSIFGYQKGVTIAPFTLIDENPDALRAFATLRGPNDYGAFLIVPLLVALVLGIRRVWLWAVAALLLVGLGVSGSRSAWIGTLIALVVFGVALLGSKMFSSRKVIAGLVIGFTLGLVSFYTALAVPAVRLAVFHSSPSDSSLTEGSTDAHWQSTGDGIERVLRSPLGCGPGCAGPASYYGNSPQISENYYVQVAEEVGIIGLGLFVTLFFIVLARLYTLRTDTLALVLFASGVGIASIGLLLHVWSDDPLSLTYFALAGMVLGYYARVNTGKNDTKKVL